MPVVGYIGGDMGDEDAVRGADVLVGDATESKSERAGERMER